MITPPHSITEVIKVMNNKEYVWCTKCRHGEGLWVCTHTSEMHQEGYRRNKTNNNTPPEHRKGPPRVPYNNNFQNHTPHNVQYPPAFQPPPQPKLHLSLTDHLDRCFNDSGENPFSVKNS